MTNINVRIRRASKKKVSDLAEKHGRTMGEMLDDILQQWLTKHENEAFKENDNSDIAVKKKLRKQEDTEQLGVEVKDATKNRLKKETKRRYWHEPNRKFPHSIVDAVEAAITECSDSKS